MNPLASLKCAGRPLMALAAISSILLIAGCGSNNGAAPNNNGFNNASLSGTYVFSSAGTDANGNTLVLTGVLVADGINSITGGTMDVVDPAVSISPGLQITKGPYSVSSDGRELATLNSSLGTPFILDFVLTSSGHGLVSEFDGNGTGSGTIDIQTPLTGLSQLAGPYAFSLAGSDSENNPLATAGAFTLNSSGAITAGTGIEDFNDDGLIFTPGDLTGGTPALGSGTNPSQLTLSATFGALVFDAYPVDATHLKLVETDGTEFLSGDVFTQTGASFPIGPMVFTMAGGTFNSGPVGSGGLMNSVDGTGNLTGGLEDVNVSGVVPPQLEFSGSPISGGPTIGGRVSVALNGFVPDVDGASQWVVYPFSSPSGNGLLMMETDEANVMTGAAFAQTATAFSASDYGLNLSGENANFVVNSIAQFNATSAASNNMTGLLDENDQGSPLQGLSLSGTYTPDSPATGRGSIIATTPGTFLGGLSLEYYVIDSSATLFMEVDNEQVSVGSFELQSTPGGAMRSRVAIVHPSVRPHGALRHK